MRAIYSLYLRYMHPNILLALPFKCINRVLNQFNLLNNANLNELISESAGAFLIKIMGLGVGYLFTMLIARFFGAEVVGSVSLSLAVISLVTIVSVLGLDTAIVRFIAEYAWQEKHESVREVYVKSIKLTTAMGSLSSVLLFFLSPYIANKFFHNEALAIYFRISSFVILPMAYMFINSQSLRGLKKIKDFMFLQNVSINLFAALFLLPFLPFFKDSRITLIAYSFSVVFAALLSLFVWFKKSGYFSLPRSNDLKIHVLLRTSLPMLLASSMVLILQWTDTIMLGIFKTEKEVGVFNVAMKISLLTSISLLAINSIAAPKFAEYYSKGDMKGLESIIHQSTKMIFWTSFPILIVTLSFPTLILGFFGNEFKTGIYALFVLVGAQFINAISGSVGYVLQMTGKQNVFLFIMLLALVANITLNRFLIPPLGLDGAAISSLIGISIWNLLSVFYIKSRLKILTIYFPLLKITRWH